MSSSKELSRIPFTEKETEVILLLSKWMKIFVIFFSVVGFIYFGLSVNFFINGFGSWGLEPKELFSIILFVIGLIAIWLGVQLSGTHKYIELVLKNDNADQEYLGQAFRKLRNFFFTGAILTIFVVLTIIVGIAFIFLREF